MLKEYEKVQQKKKVWDITINVEQTWESLLILIDNKAAFFWFIFLGGVGV